LYFEVRIYNIIHVQCAATLLDWGWDVVYYIYICKYLKKEYTTYMHLGGIYVTLVDLSDYTVTTNSDTMVDLV